MMISLTNAWIVSCRGGIVTVRIWGYGDNAGAMTILIVDDESESRTLLTTLLSEHGYRVRAADGGELALVTIMETRPDLILLDIRMPGMNGFEVYRQLKNRAETQDIPVMFISASSELDEKVEGLRLGAVDYVTKPFQREELLARVGTHLELGRLRGHLEEQVATRTAELSDSEQRSRNLAARLIDAQEEERRRIARELHDDLSQRLAVLGMLVGGIKHDIGNSNDKARVGLTEVRDRLIDLHSAIRALSHNLHPGVVERAGLAEALRLHCGEFSKVTSTPVSLETTGDLQKLDALTALGLFRVTQEALNNVQKHAAATHVEILLSSDEKGAELTIGDNGSGFDPHSVNRNVGLGLNSMEERIRFLGGSVQIESTRGGGTKIQVNIPVRQSTMAAFAAGR